MKPEQVEAPPVKPPTSKYPLKPEALQQKPKPEVTPENERGGVTLEVIHDDELDIDDKTVELAEAIGYERRLAEMEPAQVEEEWRKAHEVIGKKAPKVAPGATAMREEISKMIGTMKDEVSEDVAAPEPEGAVDDGIVDQGVQDLLSAIRGEKSEQTTKGDEAPSMQASPSQVDSPEFKKWFGESKVVDEDNTPKTFYHGGSFNAEGDRVFNTEGIGSHFGTENAANDRIFGKPVDDEINAVTAFKEKEGWVYSSDLIDLYNDFDDEYDTTEYFDTEKEAIEAGQKKAKDIAVDMDYENPEVDITDVYLSIKNPLRLPDLGTWDFNNVVREAKKRGALTSDNVADASELYARKSNDDGWKLLKESLVQNGYDGIVYANKIEDKGKDSWIAFYPTQVKSASINKGTFDSASPDVTASRQKTNKTPVVRTTPQEIYRRVAAEPALSRSKVTLDPKTGWTKIVTPEGDVATVELASEESLRGRLTKEAIAASEKSGDITGGIVAGTYQYGKGHLRINPNATADAITHELAHFLEDVGVVSKNEMKTFEGEDTTARENFAYKYQEWVKQGKPNATTTEKLFERVYDFVAGLVGSKKAKQRQIFRKIDSGKLAKQYDAVRPNSLIAASFDKAKVNLASVTNAFSDKSKAVLDVLAKLSDLEGRMNEIISKTKPDKTEKVYAANIDAVLKKDKKIRAELESLQAELNLMGEPVKVIANGKITPYTLEDRPKVWTNVKAAQINPKTNKPDENGKWFVVNQEASTGTKKRGIEFKLAGPFKTPAEARKRANQMRLAGEVVESTNKYQFSALGRSITQTTVETLSTETFDNLRRETIAAVEEAYGKAIRKDRPVSAPTISEKKKLDASKEAADAVYDSELESKKAEHDALDKDSAKAFRDEIRSRTHAKHKALQKKIKDAATKRAKGAVKEKLKSVSADQKKVKGKEFLGELKRDATIQRWADSTLGKTRSNIGTMGDVRLSTPLKSAHKTYMALNLNSLCPMFNIGNHGCYMDACYVTSMLAGAQVLNIYQKAMYSGEILQLTDAEVAKLNTIGGLRMNGMGDLDIGQKEQVRDVLRHAAMRGLKVKVITKQDATMQIFSEIVAEEPAKNVPEFTIQPTIDPYWVPITVDDRPGSPMQGMAAQIEKGGDNAQTLIDFAVDYYKQAGRDVRMIDGMPYRKYGFSGRQVNSAKKKYANIADRIVPRLVVSNAQEAVWAALEHPDAVVTWMHAVVRAGMWSEVSRKPLLPTVGQAAEGQLSWHAYNFDGRPVFQKNEKSGEWEMGQEGTGAHAWAMFVQSEKHGGKTKPTTATEKLVDYIYRYHPDKADQIFTTLKKNSCCQGGMSKDACLDCAVHCLTCRSGSPDQLVQLNKPPEALKTKSRGSRRRAARREQLRDLRAEVERNATDLVKAVKRAPGASVAGLDLITDPAVLKAAKDLVKNLAKLGVTKIADIADRMVAKVGEAAWEEMRPAVAQVWHESQDETQDLEGAGPRGEHSPWYTRETPFKEMKMPELISFARHLGAEVISKGMQKSLRGYFKVNPALDITMIALNRAFESVDAMSATLAHEIGHWIDYLDDKTLKRGNILGRLRGIRDYLEGEDGFAEEVKDELIGLSRWWRGEWEPDTSYGRYRESSRELYADAVSVLFNSPDQLAWWAPNFHKQFFNFLENKPKVAKALNELQEILNGTPEDLAIRRSANNKLMFENAREVWDKARISKRVNDRSWLRQLQDLIGENFLMKVFSPRRQLLQSESAQRVEDVEDASLALEELSHVQNRNAKMTRDLDEKVFEPMRQDKIDVDLLGEYTFLHRIAAGGRFKNKVEIFNPQGYNANEAAKQLSGLEDIHGSDFMAKVRKHAKAFHDIVWEIVQEAGQSGVYGIAKVADLSKNKDSYVAFAVIDYLNGKNISAAMHEQVGTLQDIQNPVHSTILKMYSLNNWSQRNAINRKFTNQWASDEMLGQDIHTGKLPHKQTEMPKGSAREGFDWMYTWVDGVKTPHEVPKEVAQAFAPMSTGSMQDAFRVYSSYAYGIFHPLYIGWSLGFAVANPFRDIQRTANNLAGVKIGLPGVNTVEVALRWLAAMPEGMADESPTFKKIFGISTKTLERLRDEKAVSISYAKAAAEITEGGTRDEVLEKMGLIGREEWKNMSFRKRLGKVAYSPLHVLEIIAGASDTASKIGGAKMIEARGVPVHRKASYVRRFVGTPDYKQEGRLTRYTNAALMYSRVRWVGLQHDTSLAFGQVAEGSALRWWTSFFLGTLMPYLMSRHVLYPFLNGLLGGDDEDEEMGREATKRFGFGFSDYLWRHYVMLPMGFSKDADGDLAVKAISIPRGDFQKLLLSLYHYAEEAAILKMGLKGSRTSKYASVSDISTEAIADIRDELIPGVTPIVKMVYGSMQHFAGKSPYNNMFNKDVWKDYHTDAEKNEKYQEWLFSHLGSPGQWGKFLMEPTFKNMPGVSRIYREHKVSSMETGQRYLAKRRKDQRDRAFKNSLPKDATELASEHNLITTTSGMNSVEDKARRKLLNRYMNSYYIHLGDVIEDARKSGNKVEEDKAMKTLKEVSRAIKERKNAALLPLTEVPDVLKPLYVDYLANLMKELKANPPVPKTKNKVVVESDADYQDRYLRYAEKKILSLEAASAFGEAQGNDQSANLKEIEMLKTRRDVIKKKLGRD